MTPSKCYIEGCDQPSIGMVHPSKPACYRHIHQWADNLSASTEEPITHQQWLEAMRQRIEDIAESVYQSHKPGRKPKLNGHDALRQ